MDFFCSFCSKLEDEVPLIEISSNLLFINQVHYDFPKVFYELFRITSEDLLSNFICEICKDTIVQFFLFKNNISCQMNQHKKMILTQVEDFLSQTCSIEDIQVIRKLNSLTILAEEAVIKAPSIIIEESAQDDHEIAVDQCIFMDDENEEDSDDDVPEQDFDEPAEKNDFYDKDINMMFEETSYYPCLKCDELFKSNGDLDIHEFFKHSLVGMRIKNQTESIIESEENTTEVIRKCALCVLCFEDSAATALHILDNHISDVITNINESYFILPNSLEEESIQKYISHIKELMQSNLSEIDREVKKKFFDQYAGDLMRTEVVRPETLVESDDDNDYFNHYVKNPEKKVKKTRNLTVEKRTWIRREIHLRKKTTLNENGKKQFIYQCVYCTKFSSNSAPGFRYHLMSKHLIDDSPENLQEVEPQFHMPPTRSKLEKNTCFDCNLKFKDHKLFKSHINCHELFAVIAQDYMFPSCNTCSKFFIDESTLEQHLVQHNSNEDVTLPVQVERGALAIQGKLLLTDSNNDLIDDIPDIEFSWKCGHCSKRFHKEEVCRFHLLMLHAPHFVCPIEKREFHGFKAVSLFAHHLKNKHSHLFPEITFPCTFCKLEFSSVYDKLSHMKNCNLKKFSCDHCGKKFFKKGDLIAHLKFVSGELFYPCQICYKRFETMSDLKIHLRSHTKEKPFECSICAKSFRTLAGRSAHVETHNTSTLYSCFCGKSFKQRQMYRRHVKAVHETSEKTENSFVVGSYEEDSQ